jgi:hypothetical protein
MKKEESTLKRRYQDFQKNMKALKQANITPAQMVNSMKAGDVWWKIMVNLKEIEGSWPKAIQTYIKFFKGVPRKSIHQSDKDQPEDSQSASS